MNFWGMHSDHSTILSSLIFFSSKSKLAAEGCFPHFWVVYNLDMLIISDGFMWVLMNFLRILY